MRDEEGEELPPPGRPRHDRQRRAADAAGRGAQPPGQDGYVELAARFAAASLLLPRGTHGRAPRDLEPRVYPLRCSLFFYVPVYSRVERAPARAVTFV